MGRPEFKLIEGGAVYTVKAKADLPSAPDSVRAVRKKRAPKKDNKPSMRDRSGQVESADPVVSLLYLMARDHVPVGKIEDLLREVSTGDTVEFSNGWLASWALDVAARLRTE